MHTAKRGFTLIEISVVLVIIGLIAGAVVVGQTLIHASELQSVVSDVQKFTAATNSFMTKYNALPGDMPRATRLWGTKAPNCTLPNYGDQGTLTCNGDGDGKVGNADFDWENWQLPEYMYFWQHLSNAEMIPGHYIGGLAGLMASGYNQVDVGVIVPASKMNSKAGYIFFWLGQNGGYNASDPFFTISASYGHIFLFGMQSPTAHADWEDLPAFPVLSTADALNIDLKMDDGKPGSGKVMGTQSGNYFSPSCTTSIDPVAANYNLTVKGPQCPLVFLSGI